MQRVKEELEFLECTFKPQINVTKIQPKFQGPEKIERKLV